MREILFRGKCTDTGEWVEGFYAKSGDKTFILVDNDIAVGYVTMKEVIPETVGQFTGLTDKNGERIFEGDIVKWDGTEISSIRYCDGVYRLCNAKGYYSVSVHNHFSYVEVIGNIHDNPDLLN